jgi:hypothetical protein
MVLQADERKDKETTYPWSVRLQRIHLLADKLTAGVNLGGQSAGHQC